MTPEELKKHMEEQAKAAAELHKALEGKADADKIAKIQTALDESEKRNQEITRELLARKSAQDEIEKKLNRFEIGNRGSGTEAERLAAERKSAFFGFIRKGRENLSAEETKALVQSDDTAGGYFATVEYVKEIIKAVVLYSPVRDLVRVRPTSQRAVQVPKRTGTAAAVWVGESQTRSETQNPAYGLVEIPTHEMTAEVYVSFAELEDSAFDIEAELRQEFAEQFAVAEGAAVINGDGIAKPMGCLAAASGLAYTPSGQAATIAGAAAGSAGAGDPLVTLSHAVKSEYARNGVWCLNRASLGAVRKLKDSQGRYLWEPGMANGMPNTILGAPYCECPDMPDEGANAYPICFGDMRRCYTLIDRLAISVIRDPYTKASAGQVKFLARRRIGGQVVLSEACRLLKCATS